MLLRSNMTKLRVLHVINHIYPVLGYQETFLAKAHSCGNETLVISSNKFTRFIFDANKSLLQSNLPKTGFSVENGINILRLPVQFDINLFDNPWLIGLETAVKNFKPDVIICHGLVSVTSIRLVLLMRQLHNVHLIIDDHMTYNATRGGWFYLFYKFFRVVFSPLFLKKVDAFIAVTPETKNFMNRFYGIPKERITVIPLGVSLDDFYYDGIARNSIRKKYDIKNDDLVFIYAGKVVPEKGVHLFVEAALKLSKKSDKYKFLIVGGQTTSYLNSLTLKIKNAKKEHLFHFVDAVPNRDLHKYYSSADVGVWPLQCSMTMLEAAACGLPIIISDKCGAIERIECGNGLTYNESNIVDLSRQMENLTNQSLRKSFSKKALEYVQSLSWTHIAERFLDI